MGLMDLVRKISEKKHEKSKKFKEMQEDDRLNTMLEERKLSANERELNRFIHEQREKEIKEKLEVIHKKQNHDNWKSNSILAQKMNILKDDRPILKEKNIFKDNKKKAPFVNGGGMFFK